MALAGVNYIQSSRRLPELRHPENEGGIQELEPRKAQHSIWPAEERPRVGPAVADNLCSLPHQLPLLAGEELHAETVGVEFRSQPLSRAWLDTHFRPLLCGMCGDRVCILWYSGDGNATPDAVPPCIAPFHHRSKPGTVCHPL